MKLKLLIAILLLSLTGLSQKLSDSTCLPNSQLKVLLKIIKEGEYTTAELKSVKIENDLLIKRLDVKDNIIRSWQSKGTLLQAIIANKELETANLLRQKVILEQGIKQGQKDLKSQKRKTFLTGAAGVLASLGLFFLLVTK